jgi:hypothetical protein
MREDDEALVATVTFFRALRREWVTRCGKPSETCPIPNWVDIKPIDRAPFLRSMKVALASTSPDNLSKVLASLANALE